MATASRDHNSGLRLALLPWRRTGGCSVSAETFGKCPRQLQKTFPRKREAAFSASLRLDPCHGSRPVHDILRDSGTDSIDRRETADVAERLSSITGLTDTTLDTNAVG